jgi:hypothetical protein
MRVSFSARPYQELYAKTQFVKPLDSLRRERERLKGCLLCRSLLLFI